MAKKRATQEAKPDLTHIAEPIRSLAVPLAEIGEDPRNARAHGEANLAAICASLKRFGQLKPAVGNKSTGRLEAGHGMLAAARQLGWSHLAVVWVEHTDAEARDFGLADNRTAELAEWDNAVLDQLLAELKTEDGGEDFADVMLFDELGLPGSAPPDRSNPEPQIDRKAQLQQEWATEDGQLWAVEGQAGEHRILCGDSTMASSVAILLGGVSPFLMVTDPPYGVEYEPEWRNKVRTPSDRTGKVKNDDRASWASAFRLFPGDVAYVWHESLHAADVERSLLVAGFELRSQIIWAKQRFALSRQHYHWRHETCFYAVKRGGKARWGGGENAIQSGPTSSTTFLQKSRYLPLKSTSPRYTRLTRR